MKWLSRAWGIISILPNRLISKWGLVLATLLGLVTSISLVLSIPLYADSVYFKIFQRNITSTGEDAGTRPPFSFLFHYYGGWSGNKQWEDIEALDQYMSTSASQVLGLPERFRVRYFRTDTFPLFTLGQSTYDEKASLAWNSLGFMSGLENHIKLVEGQFPTTSPGSSDTPIEVLVSLPLATDLGLQAGEEYVAFIKGETEAGVETTTQLPLRVSGIWEPLDPTEEYWITLPSNYDGVLFVPEQTFLGRVSALLPDEIFSAYWYLVMDGSNVHSSDAGSLSSRIVTLQREAGNLLSDLRLSVSPKEELETYQRASNLLTIMLYAFSIPVIGIILAFISLVSRLSVERQRNEIAVLRSRGAASTQIIGVTVLEGILLSLAAFLISIPVASQITRMIGGIGSFLRFTDTPELRVGLSSGIMRIGVLAVSLVLATMVIPALSASRNTILSYKQESSRVLKAPWWQRMWLDVLLLIPAAYGAYILKEQGSLVIFGGGGATRELLQNPLLFLVPALGILAMTMFSLRLIQPLMAGFAWLGSQTKIVGLVLAARQLSRTPGTYHTPLVILALTVSLSTYTASLAYTLDKHLYDQVNYANGSGVKFLEVGDTVMDQPFGRQTAPVEEGNAELTEDTGPRWLFIPVSEYLKIDGVKAASRVGRYTAYSNLPVDGNKEGVFMGVDRVEFPGVAFWREDFASESLGGLMNAIAIDPASVLVDHNTMIKNQLNKGDIVRLFVDTYGQQNQMDFRVAGSFNLFPTWYRDEGPLFIGNLDYLYENAGGQFPYQVWLRTVNNFDYGNMVEQGSRDLGVWLTDWKSAEIVLNEEQIKPERQGLFGFLYIGFLAAAVLTMLAFLLYVIYSFRLRNIELGVLRSGGLSKWQMSGYLIWELAFLILIGSGLGTALGYWTSRYFIPFLQIGADTAELTPPFEVIIAWPIMFRLYALVGVLFLFTITISFILLSRMKIFQAIKLGETV